MPNAFGHRGCNDAAVVIDHAEHRLSRAALYREHPAKQVRQMFGTLDRVGDDPELSP